MTRAKDISKIVTDANLSGTLDVAGTVTAGGLETINGTNISMDAIGSGQIKIDGDAYISAIALDANGMNIYTNSAARDVILGTNETQRLRVEGNGDISFYEDTGTTPKLFWDASAECLGLNGSPSAWSNFNVVEFANDVYVGSFTGGTIAGYLGTNNYYNGTNFIYSNSSYATRYQQVDGTHQFFTAPSGTAGAAIAFTESLRINSSGIVNINCTTQQIVTNERLRLVGKAAFTVAGDAALNLNRDSDNGGTVRFHRGTTQVGEISVTASSTNYGTSSDHRLKENVVEMTDATTRLKQLQPKRFNFIADADTTIDGFLAHEVQSVVPEAITGTHNEVDADGNPVYQGIDQSKLVPLLVKTIQELEARIVALETA